MASVRLDDVTVVLEGSEAPVFSGLDLTVADGELLAIAGPSGSGKTTILRLIAGLIQPASGRVWFGDEDLTGVHAVDRDVAMVFQDYALYAHRTAERNITFPLESTGVKPEAERRRRAVEEAANLSIEHLLDRLPGQLAAGHRQSVATARSLVKRSRVLLLDEPLVHLDARARLRGRLEVQRLHRELGSTIVYVTNDQAEAMAVGDRVAILADGRIQQVGPPGEVFGHPVNVTVATFLGTPPMSMLPGEISREDGDWAVLVGTDRLRIDGAEALADWVGRPITVGIRPHHLDVRTAGIPFDRCLHGRVTATEDHGDRAFATVDLGVAGAEVTVCVAAPPGLQIGDRVEVAVADGSIRFFDPATGAALG